MSVPEGRLRFPLLFRNSVNSWPLVTAADRRFPKVEARTPLAIEVPASTRVSRGTSDRSDRPNSSRRSGRRQPVSSLNRRPRAKEFEMIRPEQLLYLIVGLAHIMLAFLKAGKS